jgi:hypothetical protein
MNMSCLPRLLCFACALSLACGRTSAGKNSRWDAGQDDGSDERQGDAQDALLAPDLNLGPDSIDGKRSCGTLTMGPLKWPVVELVVDRSVSLQAPVAEGQSGWKVTRDALERVISRLTPASPAVGLTLFPNSGDCTVAPVAVPAAPITDQTKAGLIAALDQVLPGGARSPAAALALAEADATKVFPGGLTLSPFKTLILLTAGAPDPSPLCTGQDNSVAALLAQVQSAYQRSARTWVLAIPGAASSLDVLREVADFGCGLSGLPDASSHSVCLRDCDQGSASGTLIESGLECILYGGSLDGNECVPPPYDYGYRSCAIPLPSFSADVDLDDVTVLMTIGVSPARVVPRVDCSSNADGWDYTPDDQHIVLCGQACADAAATWYESVTFGCKGG